MPIYQYRCQDCGKVKEVIQKVTDPSLIICPFCNKHSLRKIISPVGVIFKGSGFHTTDYKGKAPAASISEKLSKEKEKTKPVAKTGDKTEKKEKKGKGKKEIK